ncbi:MAG: hypothetical protein KFF72_08115 [Arthrospira sp. SH-MAG29]|nr:hypothetical protein [Arthrospira sp. SH-MAG29]MBS0016313.1 hypothetical protein [Arthrospira sp. SH-MAG29]
MSGIFIGIFSGQAGLKVLVYGNCTSETGFLSGCRNSARSPVSEFSRYGIRNQARSLPSLLRFKQM